MILRQSQLRSVAQQNPVIAPKPRLQLPNPIQIHDRRTVYPEKLSRVKPRFQLVHSLPNHMRLAGDVQADVIIGSLDPVDIGEFHEHHAAIVADRDSVWRYARRKWRRLRETG